MSSPGNSRMGLGDGIRGAAGDAMATLHAQRRPQKTDLGARQVHGTTATWLNLCECAYGYRQSNPGVSSLSVEPGKRLAR